MRLPGPAHRAALRELLDMPEVKEVDPPARPVFEHVEFFQADVGPWIFRSTSEMTWSESLSSTAESPNNIR